jgi:UDP-N-acetylglucosamine 2-epimerase (non-hydrolysing)
VVVGDVNSTIACALVATKLGVRVAHVEAGLRSFDREMPEEINRVLTDAISDKLFVTERSGIENLKNEGVSDDRVHLVGNVMIDTLLKSRAKADRSTILTGLELTPKKYVAVTLHRPGNVDNKEQFGAILAAFEQIAKTTPIVFPVHPRTRKNLESMGLSGRIDAIADLKMIEPLGYFDFLKLTSEAAAVLTDSGGIQEETTILGVPCLTLRENTERPITIEQGTNRLIGCDTKTIVAALSDTLSNPPVGRTPDLWDGKAATRIVDILVGAS